MDKILYYYYNMGLDLYIFDKCKIPITEYEVNHCYIDENHGPFCEKCKCKKTICKLVIKICNLLKINIEDEDDDLVYEIYDILDNYKIKKRKKTGQKNIF